MGTIGGECADIPSGNTVEVEEGKVGVLDDVADTICRYVFYFVQIDGLQSDGTISQ